MDIYTPSTTVDTNIQSVSSQPMTIDPDSIPLIISVLTNMYSNSELTVLQEIANNALDSHVLAGQNKSVEITMPTAFNPSFTVKDYGVGMSMDDINSIYRMYGKSTKRGDKDQIGGFGYGAKSPLSIASQYSMVSIKDGIKNVVIISLGESNVGNVDIISSTPTDEPNGVEVSVPIENVSKFNEQSKNFFLGWNADKVVVNGKKLVNTIFNTDVWTDVNGYGWFSPTQPRKYSSYGPRVRVGTVIFDVKDYSLVTYSETLGMNRYMTNCSIVSMAIQDVDLTPSREDIRYTPRTVNNIKKAYEQFYASLKNTMVEKLNSMENRVEALKTYTNLINSGVNIPAVWNGEYITATYVNIDGKPLAKTVSTADKVRTKTSDGDVPLSVYSVNTKGVILRATVASEEELGTITRNLKDYMKAVDANTVTVVVTYEGDDVDPWLDAVGETTTVNEISEKALAHRRLVRSKSKNTSAKKAAKASYFFTDYDKKIYNVKTSVNEISDDVLYVSSPNFSGIASLFSNLNPYSISEHSAKKIETIKNFGINTQIVSIPENISVDRFIKFFPATRNLHTVIQEKISEWFDSLTEDTKAAFVNIVKASSPQEKNVDAFCAVLASNGKMDKIHSEKTRSYIVQTLEMKDPSSMSARALALLHLDTLLVGWFFRKYEEYFLSKQQNETFVARYPLVASFEHYSNPWTNDTMVEHAVAYINAVDSM